MFYYIERKQADRHVTFLSICIIDPLMHIEPRTIEHRCICKNKAESGIGAIGITVATSVLNAYDYLTTLHEQ